MSPPLNNPTQELFPQMLQGARLLVIDYDVTRYHSFDFFRYLLYRKEWFVRCEPQFLKEFVELRNPLKQIYYYKTHGYDINPFYYFDTDKYRSPNETENWMNEHFADSDLIATPTDIGQRLGVIFDRNGISGYLLKYKNDPYSPGFGDKVTVYTTDHVLNLNMATAIVKQHGINAVMTSSIELAIILAARLKADGWLQPITFMIGSYAYNYDANTGRLRHIPAINALELYYKHEFGVFNPFTGLEQMKNENLLN